MSFIGDLFSTLGIRPTPGTTKKPTFINGFRAGNMSGGTLELHVEYATVEVSGASEATGLTFPGNSIPLFVSANTDSLVVCATATKIGLGAGADPDVFGLSTGLTQNLKFGHAVDFIALGASYAAAAIPVALFSVDNVGDAAGSFTSGTVSVAIGYYTVSDLPDAD